MCCFAKIHAVLWPVTWPDIAVFQRSLPLVTSI